MKQPSPPPRLSFVWRPEEICTAVVETAGRTSTGALFDVTAISAGDASRALKAAGATDAKISLALCMDPGLDRFLQASGVDTLWVEYHPVFDTCPPQAFIDRMAALSGRCTCIPTTKRRLAGDRISSRLQAPFGTG